MPRPSPRPATSTRPSLHALLAGTLLPGALLLGACAPERPTALEPRAAPSLRTARSPAGPGAQVWHGNGQFFATFAEPGAPYFVAVGASASAAREFCAGGDPAFGDARDLFIEGPNGIRAVFRSDGKVPLLLYPAGTEDICDGSPIAEGTGLYTDVSSNLIGGNGRGTAGFRIRGEVTDAAGERHHVLVVVQRQLGRDGFEDVVVKVDVR